MSPNIEVATEPLSDKMLSKMELVGLLPDNVVSEKPDPDLLLDVEADVDGDSGVSAFGVAIEGAVDVEVGVVVDLEDLGV